MRFNTASSLALGSILGITAMPLSPTSDTSLNPALHLLNARDTYDCSGSGLCQSLQVKYCDQAVNDRIIRNNDVNYGAPGSGRQYSGACQSSSGGFAYGCGVFIQGKSTCARTGNDIWYDYQAIRSQGCRVCGSRHWGDGCLTTINYVGGCTSGSG
ncbi:hypothetical protein HD806DRAFT_539401 [Xylariaceae sp. AK1471]|nr:hypothetical protein HD806DRAFT_539401 [Xylariaceae sp. AK1471]